MILLILSVLNFFFTENIPLLQFGIALFIFIICEIKRKDGDTRKTLVIAQIVSALILLMKIIYLVLSFVRRM